MFLFGFCFEEDISEQAQIYYQIKKNAAGTAFLEIYFKHSIPYEYKEKLLEKTLPMQSILKIGMETKYAYVLIVPLSQCAVSADEMDLNITYDNMADAIYIHLDAKKENDIVDIIATDKDDHNCSIIFEGHPEKEFISGIEIWYAKEMYGICNRLK